MTESSPQRGARRPLTQAAFDELLAAFDPDRDRAGEKYERMRSKLVTFFRHRRASAPEELADDTLTRVAHKIAEGARIPSDELHSYVYGFAHNVLRSDWRVKARTDHLDEVPAARRPWLDPRRDDAPERERRLDCLGRCVAGLAAADQELLVRYHTGDGRERIEERKALADSLGCSPVSLRVRVHRIQRQVESCTRACLERQER
jgi:DNA-directed RNA polymerase specialized sigma24 family protein